MFTTNITNINRFQENSRTPKIHQATEYWNKQESVRTFLTMLTISRKIGKNHITNKYM